MDAAPEARLAAGCGAPASTVVVAIRSAVVWFRKPPWPVLNSRHRLPSVHRRRWVLMPRPSRRLDMCWLACSALRRSSVKQRTARTAPGRAWRPYGPLTASQALSWSRAVVGRSRRTIGSPCRKGTRTIDSSGLITSTSATPNTRQPHWPGRLAGPDEAVEHCPRANPEIRHDSERLGPGPDPPCPIPPRLRSTLRRATRYPGMTGPIELKLLRAPDRTHHGLRGLVD